MELISDLTQLRQQRTRWKGTLGLVPTMGALHEGHLTLVRQSVRENDHTLVSIFVNPTQFGPNEDFDKYPRNLEKDQSLFADLGVDFVFAPDTRSIYPAGDTFITFQLSKLDEVLCARSRPGHMNGVLQIVSILFNLIQPSRAYFGLKDYQQQLILQTLVRELHFPLTVVPCPIVRDPDGLAMSSRNAYLSPKEREQALALSQTLAQIKLRRTIWESVDEILEFGRAQLQPFPLIELDYLEVLGGKDLQPVSSLHPAQHPVTFVAAWVGKTRLIDNMPIWEYPE